MMPIFVVVVTIILVVVVVGGAEGDGDEDKEAREGDRRSLVEASVWRERPGDRADDEAETEIAVADCEERRRRYAGFGLMAGS